MSEGHLCIGGPKDGKRVENHGLRFGAAVRGGKTVHYHLEIFHTPQGEILFWMPEGQTPMEAMTMLAEAYERDKGRDQP